MPTTLIKRQANTVETNSRLKMWWLNAFQGYQVTEEKLYPRKGTFGRISYERIWVLKSGGTGA